MRDLIALNIPRLSPDTVAFEDALDTANTLISCSLEIRADPKLTELITPLLSIPAPPSLQSQDIPSVNVASSFVELDTESGTGTRYRVLEEWENMACRVGWAWRLGKGREGEVSMRGTKHDDG